MPIGVEDDHSSKVAGCAIPPGSSGELVLEPDRGEARAQPAAERFFGGILLRYGVAQDFSDLLLGTAAVAACAALQTRLDVIFQSADHELSHAGFQFLAMIKWCSAYRSFGSSASRRPSPMKLKQNSVIGEEGGREDQEPGGGFHLGRTLGDQHAPGGQRLLDAEAEKADGKNSVRITCGTVSVT